MHVYKPRHKVFAAEVDRFVAVRYRVAFRQHVRYFFAVDENDRVARGHVFASVEYFSVYKRVFFHNAVIINCFSFFVKSA